jgi:hypothetical protein
MPDGQCQERHSTKAVEVRRSRVRHGVSRGLVLAAALWLTWTSPALVAQRAQAPTTTPVLRDLAGIADLQARFDQERDKVRIVLLLSPT